MKFEINKKHLEMLKNPDEIIIMMLFSKMYENFSNGQTPDEAFEFLLSNVAIAICNITDISDIDKNKKDFVSFIEENEDILREVCSGIMEKIIQKLPNHGLNLKDDTNDFSKYPKSEC